MSDEREADGNGASSAPARSIEVPDVGYPRSAEWLEADGLGGFAMGTVDGIRTRRYHGLLIHAVTPPTGRMALVNGFEAWVDLDGLSLAITSQRYAPGAVHPDGASRLASFAAEPWPRWTFDLGPGLSLEQELFVRHGQPLCVLRWRLSAPAAAARLRVRPLLSGRDSHRLQRANDAFRFEPEGEGALRTWRPYQGVPEILSLSNGEYSHAPEWYRQFLYAEERARGLDDLEDLASPGVLTFDLNQSDAVWMVAAGTPGTRTLLTGADPETLARGLAAHEERRRGAFATPLDRAADAYRVARATGRTLVAGYPWFTDWGRDTFVALPGLCLATGALDDARRILLEWSAAVSEGMIPNRFVEPGGVPEYHSVDASLWYVVAVHRWLDAMAAASAPLAAADRVLLRAAIQTILEAYTRGTRHGIEADDDDLLRAGEPGVALTWMDARHGDREVTPRVGKPVEVEALWINALWVGGAFDPRWRHACERALESFGARFWNEERGCLYDVVDVDHRPGAIDATLRPNQILAVGGLPFPLVADERARSVVQIVERELMTPLGPRSLAPSEPGYVGHYRGGPSERDCAYHQGTVWPWLMGPFVEAWVRARGGTDAARREARERFVLPMLSHLDQTGLGHLAEIADGDPPHDSRGCPFQAWSLGELLWLEREVLVDPERREAVAADMREHEPSGA
jgi:predicted glycogen debranching enzyme